MRFTRDRTKQDLVNIILECRDENHGGSLPNGKLSYDELTHHPLMKHTREELLKIANAEVTKCEPGIPSVMDVVLEDDENAEGGVLFLGETVRDFIDSVWPVEFKTMEELNEALVICGIKPLCQTNV